MPDKEVRWFSFPFIAPKGRGAKAQQAQGEIFEIDPPPETSAPRASRRDEMFWLTPQKRRERIIKLLAIGLNRCAAKQRKKD